MNAAIYQEVLEYFLIPSAEQLFRDEDYIFQCDLAPAQCQIYKSMDGGS